MTEVGESDSKLKWKLLNSRSCTWAAKIDQNISTAVNSPKLQHPLTENRHRWRRWEWLW